MKLFEKDSDKRYYLNAVKEEWLAASEKFPDFLKEVPQEAKLQNELYVQTVSDDFRKQINGFPRISPGRKKWKQKMLNLLTDVLCRETVIGVHQSMDPQAITLAKEELMEFTRHVRKFSPELSFSEIGQAIRNYIVYIMFKEINQIKTGFSMACFGYSMLYPFTDNYIDSANVTKKDKAEYNRLIRDTIEGREVHAKTLHQQKTCELLQAIASDYPREIDSTIYKLLLMMLEAQEISMRQQYQENQDTVTIPAEQTDKSNLTVINNSGNSPLPGNRTGKQVPDKEGKSLGYDERKSLSYDEGKSFSYSERKSLGYDERKSLSYDERLDISLYKGGISVLIDRFLINRELTQKDLIFYLGLGFFLQIADDLQDIRSDGIEGNQTIFTLELHSEREEKLVNRMLHFVRNISDNYQSDNDSFKDFVLSNCYQLVFSSINRSREFFSEGYLAELEKYFLVDFSFYDKFKENMNIAANDRNQEKHRKVLDYILFE